MHRTTGNCASGNFRRRRGTRAVLALEGYGAISEKIGFQIVVFVVDGQLEGASKSPAPITSFNVTPINGFDFRGSPQS